MEQVLADDNLVNHVFWCIDDQNMNVAHRTMLNWCVANRAFLNACKTDFPKREDALLQLFFEKELKRYGSELTPLFEKADASFSERVWALQTLRRHVPKQVGRKATTALCRFIRDETAIYNQEKQRALFNMQKSDKASPDLNFPKLFDWVKPRWQNLAPFERAVYDISYKVDQRAFDRFDGVANAWMAQVVAELLGRQ